MTDENGDVGINPGMSEDDDSDDEVSLLVVDEDELQTALDRAGISIKVTKMWMLAASSWSVRASIRVAAYCYCYCCYCNCNSPSSCTLPS